MTDTESVEDSSISSSSSRSSIDINLNNGTRDVSGTIEEQQKQRKLKIKPDDRWLVGGHFGSRHAVLLFKSVALANRDERAIQNMPASKLHVAYKVVQAETRLFAKLMESHGVKELTTNGNNFNILWTGAQPKPGVLQSLAPHQRVNHFPRSTELTRKDRLYRNIAGMQRAKGAKHFDFVPQTFVMPAEYKDLHKAHTRLKGPWIVKPVASSRGRGIFIVEDPTQVPLDEPVVVARYISRPLLVRGHKCDLRLYVAVTCFDPLLIYIYEEGLVRFAAVKYDVTHKELWNPCMHLCNYSINKYHSDYIKSNDSSAENVGHKWTLSALLRHLKSEGRDTAALMSQVEDVVVKAILACANTIVFACKMFVPHSGNCFELFGFDVLIDDTLKPWLLEVNLSPSLGCDSPLDIRLKSAMLADLLTLIGIPAIDPTINHSHGGANGKQLQLSKSKQGNNCARVMSEVALGNTLPGNQSNSSCNNAKREERRMIASARSQFERRGGYVRLFPTADSWSKYGQYLDPVSGIPISGSGSNLILPLGNARNNNNMILHAQLFPGVVIVQNQASRGNHEKPAAPSSSSSSRANASDRRLLSTRNEHLLNAVNGRHQDGHKFALLPSSSPIKVAREHQVVALKREICVSIRDGKGLTRMESRKLLAQYLHRILNRMSNCARTEVVVDEETIMTIVKFLQKAAKHLKTPFHVQCPSYKLNVKERPAVVAKQLNDFLHLYNRETELYTCDNDHRRSTLVEFLQYATETDLDEVLTLLQTRVPLNNNKSGLKNSHHKNRSTTKGAKIPRT